MAVDHDRQERLQAWIEIGSGIDRWDSNRSLTVSERFMAFGWDFHVADVLRVIVDNERHYFGLKSILFSGFCTWMVRPLDIEHIRYAMMLKGNLKLAQAERRGRKLIPKNKVFGALAGRVLFPGSAFYEDFYIPISRKQRWNQVPSRAEHRKNLRKRENSVRTTLDLVKIYHWHAVHLQDSRKHNLPSLNNGIKALMEMRRISDRKTSHPDTYEDHWKQCRISAAVLYGLDAIGREQGVDLLSMVLDNNLLFNRNRWLLKEIISRAKFVAENVLAGLQNNRTSIDTLSYIPDCNATSIPCPSFSDDEIGILKNAFQRYNAF